MISQRLRGLSEDGEAIDGLLPKLEKQFSTVGISIQDQNGQLRSSFDILQDLAGVWDQLSSKQKQYFGEKVAGNRQVKTLNAIMQNWDVVTDTIDKANNAQGAAIEGNEMYMESIEGKITQLKSAFQELATTTISSDIVKVFVDIGTAIVKAVTAMGGMAPVLTVVLGLFTAIKGTKIIEFFTNLGKAITGLNGAGAALSGWVGIAIAVAGAIYGIVNATSKLNDTTKQLENAKENYQKQQSAVQNLNLELKNTQDRIDELDGKELTIIEQAELDKLKETNGELEAQIKLENKLLEIADRDQRNAAVRDVQKYQSQNAKSGTIKPYEYMNRVSDKDLLEIAGYDYSTMTPIQQSDALSSINFTNDMMADLNVKALVAAREEYEKAYKDYLKLSEDADEEIISQSKQNIADLEDEIQKYENELSSYYNTLSGKVEGISESEDNPEFTAIKNRMKEIGDYLSDDVEVSIEDQVNTILSKYDGATNIIKEKVQEFGDAFTLDSLKDAVNELGEDVDFDALVNEIATKLNLTHDKVEQLFKETFSFDSTSINPTFNVNLDDITLFSTTDSYKTLTTAMTEQQKAGVLSYETVKSLLGDEGLKGVSEYLIQTADGYALNTERIYDFIKAQDEEAKLKAIEGIMERQIQLEKLNEELANLTDAEKEAGREAELLGEISGIDQEIAQLKAAAMEADNATSALERYRAATKTANQDAEHTEGAGIYKTVQEKFKEGKIGHDDFTAGMDFLLGEGWQDRFSNDVEKAYKEAQEVGDRYFSGNDREDAKHFADDLVKKGFAEYTENGGVRMLREFSLDELINGAADVTEGFSMAGDAVESLIGLLNSYTLGEGISIDREITSAEELAVLLDKITEKTKELEDKTKERDSFDVGTEEYEAADEEVQALTNDLHEAQEAADTINESMQNAGKTEMTFEEVTAEVERLKAAMEYLANNGITVPEEATQRMRELTELVNYLQGNGPVDVDVGIKKEAFDRGAEEIESKTDELVNPEIPNDILFNATDNGSIGKLGEQADGITEKSRTIKYGVEVSDITLPTPEDIETITALDQKVKQLEMREGNGEDVFAELEAARQALAEAYNAMQEDVNARSALNDAAEKEAQDIESRLSFLDEQFDEWGKRTLENFFNKNNESPEGETLPASSDLISDGTLNVAVTNWDDLQKDVDAHKDEALTTGDQSWFNRGGFVDLYSRPRVKPDKVRAAGYDVDDNDISTVLTTTGRIGEHGEIGVVLTPILPNGDVISPDKIENALEEMFVGENGQIQLPDGMFDFNIEDILISSLDLSSVSETLQDEYLIAIAEALHEVQEKFYADEPIDLTFKPVSEYTDQERKDLFGESIEVPVEPDKPEKVINDVQKEADSNPVELSFDSLDLDTINNYFKELGSELTSGGITGVGKEYGEVIRAFNELRSAQSQLSGISPGDTAGEQEAASNLASAAEYFSEAYDTLTQKLGDMPKAEVDANTKAAIDKVKSLRREIEKPVTMPINTQVGGAAVQIPGNAKGNKNAKEGLSLVDEEGKELIQRRDGTYEIGTDNGPRMTKLEDGDIVYNAEQTKRILGRKGSVGSRFADSNIPSWINKTIKGVANLLGLTTGKSTTSTKKKNKKNSSTEEANSNIDQFKEWAEQFFDWAEIRLNRLQSITDTWLYKASTAIGSIAKNKALSNAMRSVDKQIKNTEKAYKLYIDHAEKVATEGGLTSEIVQQIQNGTISIDSYSKDMQEIIKEYQTWYEKALQCSDALRELSEQQKEIAAQRIENIINQYEDRISLYQGDIETSEARRAYKEALGKQLYGTNSRGRYGSYQTDIDEQTNTLKAQRAERRRVRRELNRQVQAGYIQVGDENWQKYTEKLKSLDAEIYNTRTAIIELHDTADQVKLTKLGYQLDSLADSASHMNEMMSLHNVQGVKETSESYKELIENGMAQIENLEKQNEALREQQSGLDVLSEKYQDIEKQIQQNTSKINEIKVSQEGWNDAIVDTGIDGLKKYKESLSKMNDEYQKQKNLQEAIYNVEKARSQRTVRTYIEGQGFVYQGDEEEIKNAQENLENVVKDQLLGKIDDLITALEESKNDTNVYDANGQLIGTEYNTPQLGTLTGVLSNYNARNGQIDVAALRDSFGGEFLSGINSSTNKNTSVNIGDIIVNEANDGNELAQAIVNQFPSALLQAMYAK